MNLLFREVEGFTELVTKLLTDGEYTALQAELLTNPKKGVLQGTGGARKVRVKEGEKAAVYVSSTTFNARRSFG